MKKEPVRILMIDRSHPVLSDLLEEGGHFELIPAYDWSRERILDGLANIAGVVLRSRISLDSTFFSRATDLQFAAREGIGLDHIDLEAAAEHHVKILNSPEGSRDTVAEHTIGFIFGMLNNIPRADAQVRRGTWDREGNRGLELKGKTLGIIGYGSIGTCLARKVSGLECRVIAYDKYRTDYGDEFAEPVSLKQLQEEADVVSLHIPYEPSNHHFVNEALLRGFKKPIYLINTSRGLILDTAALVEAMERKKISGVALDVIEYEDSSFEQLSASDGEVPAPLHYLRHSDRTILTPHIAGWSVESKERHARVLAEKIIQLFK